MIQRSTTAIPIAILITLAIVVSAATTTYATPEVSNLLLKASSPNCLTTDDLICTYNLTDATTAAIAWYKDGVPLMNLYLPMEGGSTNALLDLSGNSHTVTAMGDPTWESTGGHDGNGAFDLDGNDYLNAGESFPTLSSYTKVAWVYMTGSGSNNIISSQDGTGGHAFFASSSQGLRLTAGHSGNWYFVQDPDPLLFDTWYFVAATFDYTSGEIILYKDDAEVDRDTILAAQRDVTDATTLVGALVNGACWIGLIDDARVYDHVLSPEQLLALYHGSDTIKSTETSVGEQWYADVTPFSETEKGSTESSNTLTIKIDPPVVSGIPDQIIPEGQSFTAITLDDYVDDPNHADNEMTWTFTGNSELTVDITDRIATITVPDPDWYGSETVVFRATDPDTLYDEDTATFEVTNVNDAPVVSDIPNQAIDQGMAFSLIYLDDYVSDIDGQPEDMSWTFSGNDYLNVSIVDRVATVTVPSPDWYGLDTITFRATDTGGLFDEDQAIFTVDADPELANVTLSSTSPNPISTDDLFCSYDLQGNATTAAIAWYKDSLPLMNLYTPFEGDLPNALLDLSGNNHTVTMVGDPTFDSTGGHDGNGAFDFDGNDHLNAGESFPTLSSYTKVARVCMTNAAASNNIISSGDITGGHTLYASQSQENRLAAGQVGTWNIVKDPVPLEVYKWYFVAVTFDYATGMMVLYKDNSEVDTATVPVDKWNITDATTLIGAFIGSAQWNGLIDEVRIYNYALSYEQVLALYHGSDTIKPSETSIGEVWYADVTPFSTTEIGTTVSSNPLTIGFVNHPPSLDTILPQTVDVGDSLTFDISASDPDPHIPQLTTSQLPDGAALTDHQNGTGTFEWTPDYDQFGDFDITFYAIDDSLAADSQVVVISVIPDTVAPSVDLVSPVDDSATTNPYMLLTVTVSDENPMMLRVYGGMTTDAANLIHVQENITSTVVDYEWTSPVLQPDIASTVGLWHLDDCDSELVADESVYGNNGQLFGSKAWSPEGYFGYALELDGTNGYVEVPDDSSLDIDPETGAVTMEAWICPDISGDGQLRSIIAKRAYGGKARTVNYEMILNNDRKLMFTAGEGTSVMYLSSVVIPAGKWSYVAITVDASEGTARFCLNGEAADSVQDVLLGPMHSEPLYIGGAGPSSEPFIGRIDEVRVSNRVLEPLEIQANSMLANGTHYWRAEVTDASGNSDTSATRNFLVYMPGFQAPELIAPPDTPDSILYDMIPTFSWTAWIGPCPYDTIYYRLRIARRSDFSQETVIDSITDVSFTWIDSLSFDQQFWWKIEGWANTDTGLATVSSNVLSFYTWTLGDMDHSHAVNVADLTYLVKFLFQSGEPLDPHFIGDLDGNCQVNVADLTYLVKYLFKGGPPPRIGCA